MERLRTPDTRTVSAPGHCQVSDGASDTHPYPALTDTDYRYLQDIREVAWLCEDDTERFLHLLDARGLLALHMPRWPRTQPPQRKTRSKPCDD